MFKRSKPRSLYNCRIFLDEISEYFGVKIAMYFAWLGHYTQSLTVPAAVGFIFWVSTFLIDLVEKETP